MQIAYSYNDEFKLVGASECQLDPMASQRLGYDVPLIPGMSTLVEPPEHDPEKHFCIFDPETETWSLEEIPAPPEPTEPEEPGGEGDRPSSLDERVADLETAMSSILEVYENG